MNLVFVEERRQQLQIYLLNLVEVLPQVEACKSKAELTPVALLSLLSTKQCWQTLGDKNDWKTIDKLNNSHKKCQRMQPARYPQRLAFGTCAANCRAAPLANGARTSFVVSRKVRIRSR